MRQIKPDRTIIWNQRQLERLVVDYIDHYNAHRPHRSLDQRPPLGNDPQPRPVYLRFGNGGEFVAHAVADWARFNTVDSIFIDPGSPWQNAWIESFNGRLRDELLNMWRFDSLLEARVIIEDHRIDYNINRPHTAHGDLAPAEFAAKWYNDHQPQVA